jgi:hypothetical protein
MGITLNDINELINVTMKDCPLPSAADLIQAAREEDAEIFCEFIQEHYDISQIAEGLAEIEHRIKLAQQIYGSGQKSSSNSTGNSDDCKQDPDI